MTDPKPDEREWTIYSCSKCGFLSNEDVPHWCEEDEELVTVDQVPEVVVVPESRALAAEKRADELAEALKFYADEPDRERVAEAIIRAWRVGDPSDWWYDAADAALSALTAARRKAKPRAHATERPGNSGTDEAGTGSRKPDDARATSPDPSPPTQPVKTIRKCPQCEYETLDAIAACPMGCAPLEAVEVVPRSQLDEERGLRMMWQERTDELAELLKEAWEFPDYPSPGEGCVSTGEDYPAQEKWNEDQEALDDRVRSALSHYTEEEKDG